MSDRATDLVNQALLRQRALSRWDNEGGAEPADQADAEPPMPSVGDAEIQALHVRVIALENIVVGLLTAASDAAREQAREMAGRIAPRPGATRHPLTIHAAEHMTSLVERATKLSNRQT